MRSYMAKATNKEIAALLTGPRGLRCEKAFGQILERQETNTASFGMAGSLPAVNLQGFPVVAFHADGAFEAEKKHTRGLHSSSGRAWQIARIAARAERIRKRIKAGSVEDGPLPGRVSAFMRSLATLQLRYGVEITVLDGAINVADATPGLALTA